MVTRAVSKDVFVNKLHNWIMQHNREVGLQQGFPEDQVDLVLESQRAGNETLCGHIYDFLKLEGYIDG